MILHREISILHEHSPPWLLRLWGSSDHLVEWTRRLAFGGNGYRYWEAKCREMEHWPLERIREFQLKGVKRMIRHCYDNVPYYGKLFRKIGLLPSDIHSLGSRAYCEVLKEKP